MIDKLLDDYTKEKKTINLFWSNILSLILFIPIILVYGSIYLLIWKDYARILQAHEKFKEYEPYSIGILLLTLLIGIVVHELIHGVTFAFFAKNGFKSIKFGVLVKMLTPYCHCKEPLKCRQYIIGALMPAITLGLLPACISFFTGNVYFLAFAVFFTGVAVGDFLIVKLIWNEEKDSLVLDHPSEAGCYVFRKR